jgi:hypothetical protein
MKPVVAAPAVAQPVATPGSAVHPLEQRFMARMMGQPVPAQVPVQKPVTKPATSSPQSMPPLSLTSPLAVAKPAAPPAGITPPSAFPTFTQSARKPMKTAQPPPPMATPPMAAPASDMDGLTFTSPLAQQPAQPPKPHSQPPSGLPTAAPGAGALFGLPAQKSAQAPAAGKPEAESMNLGFDIGDAEQQIAPEQKKAMEFDSIIERFKTVITTEQKLGAYDFADKIGVADFIEQFYEFLAHPDKDGIIVYKNDEVKINKTKIMGALMLGDNSMLDRAMTGFRLWLIKVLK